MGRKGERAIRCPRLDGRIIDETECEFQPENKTCADCDLDLLLGPRVRPKKIVFDIYTKYPPEGQFPVEALAQLPGHISLNELPPETAAMLYTKKSHFKDTHNPFFAIEAFLVANEAGLYPPAWIMSWLLEAFEIFNKSEGKEDLRKLLGFAKGKGKGQGKNYALREFLEIKRNSILLNDISTLIAVFNILPGDACHMVSRRLAETPEKEFNNTGIKIKKNLSKRTLYDLYMADPSYERLMRFLKRHLKWSEKEKQKYLSQFPKDSYANIKLRLK